MNSKIMVSIICNAYNHGKYIRDALEGFVAQKTDFAFEVLVHDDASTDDTADIIREYEEKYPTLIKPIYQTKNQYSQGLSVTRDIQLARVCGKYIAVCEGDDYWIDPLKLQKQYDFLESHPEYSMCACSVDWYNLKTGCVEKRGKTTQDRDIFLEEIILEKNGRIFQFATVFFRREIWLERSDWEKKFPIADYPLALKSAVHGKVHMLADTMAVYRFYSQNSWTVRMDDDAARAKVSVRMIEGLNAFNEATDYKYNEVVKQRRLRHEYMQALMEHDLKKMRSGDLRAFYKSRSLAFRMSDIIRCNFPNLYKKMMKPLARVIKSVYGK